MIAERVRYSKGLTDMPCRRSRHPRGAQHRAAGARTRHCRTKRPRPLKVLGSELFWRIFGNVVPVNGPEPPTTPLRRTCSTNGATPAHRIGAKRSSGHGRPRAPARHHGFPDSGCGDAITADTGRSRRGYDAPGSASTNAINVVGGAPISDRPITATAEPRRMPVMRTNLPFSEGRPQVVQRMKNTTVIVSPTATIPRRSGSVRLVWRTKRAAM